MNEVAFVEKRRGDWDRLKLLCDKADLSPTQLQAQEFQELIRLYRQTSGDLAKVRTASSNLTLVEMLNALVGRAYMVLYRPRRGGVFAALAWGITEYARVARRCRFFILAALFTFLVGAFFGAAALKRAPQSREFLVPPEFEASFEQWKKGTSEARDDGEGLLATGFYASNNPRVALITSSVSAATFGFGTAYLLAQNGLMMGALHHEVAGAGHLFHLYSSIAPHGVTELQGAIIAGASGYVMGWALIAPGRRTRGQALRHAMKEALFLLLGGVIMMYLAAPFEGFFSFNPSVPYWAKIMMASLIGLAWIAFYLGVGREPESAPSPVA